MNQYELTSEDYVFIAKRTLLSVAAGIIAVIGLITIPPMSVWGCEATSDYEVRRTNAWVEYVPGECKGDFCTRSRDVIHPGRTWTERRYICEDGDRWRVEYRGEG